MSNEQSDKSFQERLATFKAAIAGRLYEVMEDNRVSDGPIALAALAEMTAEFGCMLAGKRITLEMLAELSRRVSAAADNNNLG